ncbi:MAG: transposase [Chloroflexota bacterium]|nr:transposase [Chloroflexota bacterium]
MSEEKTQHKTYGKRRSLRLPDWDYRLPYDYHVTITTRNRQPLFRQPKAVKAFVDSLRDQTRATQFTIWAFCIMPDHIHILCQPPADSEIDLTAFIGRIKSVASRALAEAGFGWKVWQRGFYDHILRSGEDRIQVARYIVANQVRKELAENVEGYPHSFVYGEKDYTGP